MANLQYIGARYVPKFYENPDTGDMTWKSGVGYEPLTVVTYNSDTYTSKIPVPSNVGNPAGSPTYWAKTADFNAALVSLQNEVNSLDGRVDALEAVKRRFIMIGDSYSHEYHGIEGWTTRVISLLGLDADQYITSCHNNSGFIGTIPTTFETLLDDAYAATAAPITADSITDVVVIGGRNDVGVNATDLANAIQSFVTKAESYFPNAKIWLGMAGMSVLDDASVQEQLHRLEFIYYGNASGNVAYMHNLNLTGRMNTNLYYDSNHPNDNGQKLLSKNIASVLNGGSVQLQSYPKRALTITADAGITGVTGDLKYTQNQNGDIVLFFSNVHAQFTAGTLTRNALLPILNLDASVPFRVNTCGTRTTICWQSTTTDLFLTTSTTLQERER